MHPAAFAIAAVSDLSGRDIAARVFVAYARLLIDALAKEDGKVGGRL